MIGAAIKFVGKYAKLFRWLGVGIASFAIMFFIYDYGKQKQNVDELETANAGLGEQIKDIRTDLEAQNQKIQNVRKSYSNIRKDFIRLDESIQSFVSMSDEQVLENREDVGSRVNTQLEQIRNRMECESGDDDKC